MKPLCLVLLLMPLGLPACTDSPPMDARISSNAAEQQAIDTWYVDTHLRGDIAAGIITQRTIYPYHFEPGSSRLTDLGRRDVGILAEYYKSTPAAIAVVRGDAADELYAARTGVVKDAFKDSGVDLARVTVGEGLPGGRGISGQSIVEAKMNETGQFSAPSTDTGSMTKEGTTSGETKGSTK
jgi:hypothetical protein